MLLLQYVFQVKVDNRVYRSDVNSAPEIGTDVQASVLILYLLMELLAYEFIHYPAGDGEQCRQCCHGRSGQEPGLQSLPGVHSVLCWY